MLSSDKNIDTISELFAELKRYIGLRTEYHKLDAIDKIVQVIKALSLLFVGLIILSMIVITLSIAAGFALAEFMHTALAFCIIAFIYLLFFFVFLAKRKQWIERPLVRFLSNLLLNS